MSVVKPGTFPEWASGGSAPIVQPPPAKAALGFFAGEEPPAETLNFLLFWVYKWTVYLDDLANQAFTWTAAHIFQNTVEFDKGITITQSTANASAFTATGNGTGEGGDFTGGSPTAGDTNGGYGARGTGGSGHGAGIGGDGLQGAGGVSGGNGVKGTGSFTGAGGLFIAGSSGYGVDATGSATKPGLIARALAASGMRGLDGVGDGAGAGVRGTGGLTGPGVEGFALAGSGKNGVEGTGDGVAGRGGLFVGDDANSGLGAEADGGGPDGIGFIARGAGDGDGINAFSGAGDGDAIQASASASGGSGRGGLFIGGSGGGIATFGAEGQGGGTNGSGLKGKPVGLGVGVRAVANGFGCTGPAFVADENTTDVAYGFSVSLAGDVSAPTMPGLFVKTVAGVKKLCYYNGVGVSIIG